MTKARDGMAVSSGAGTKGRRLKLCKLRTLLNFVGFLDLVN
jgi:hypothetical protein